MSHPIAEFRLKRRVNFYETDMAGIVHFSCFFRYMEEAEHALWREAGVSIAASGVGWPRVATSFEFHRPLRFEEEFEVYIRIAAITRKTIRYSCVLTRGDIKIATGTLTAVCVARDGPDAMKSIPIPPEITNRFQVASEVDA
jgi:YbgC/YbaW family acyl-CoA thioester hydrolase